MIVLMASLFGVSSAHLPEGVTYLAFQWPAGEEPAIDGDLSEWDIVPPKYVLNTEEGEYSRDWGFYETVNPESPPPFNGFGVFWVGWSDDRNALYLSLKHI